MTKTKQLHYLLVKVSKNRTVRIGVKVRDAKSPVALDRTLADVMAGTEGMAVTCANAQCAMRLNGAAFPHEAHLVEFTDNRAFVVDKLNRQGVPISCVRYAHNEGAFQKEFDTKGKQRLSKMSGVEKTFVLMPPPKRKSPGHGVSHGGTSGTPRNDRKHPLHKGAIARAERAGINLNPKA